MHCELNLTATCGQVSRHCNRALLKQHKIVSMDQFRFVDVA